MTHSKQQSFFNTAFWLGISQASTLLVSLLSCAVLSRYLSKNDYGTYRQVLFIYNIIFNVFSVGLSTAYSYFLPKYREGEGKNIVKNITMLLIIIGAGFTLILFLFANTFANVLNNENLKIALKLFCLTPLFTIPTLGIDSLYTTLRRTKILAIYQVFSKILVFAFSVFPVVVLKYSYLSAIVGWTIASFFSLIFAIFLLWHPFRNVKMLKVKSIYRLVLNYSLPLMCTCLVGITINMCPQFFISRFWGESSFADFSNGYISLPFVIMIANPLKQVLLPLFSKSAVSGDMEEAIATYKSGLFKCVLLLFPLIGFAFVFAQVIMQFVYGNLYISSAPFFRLSLIKDIASCFPFLAIILAFGKTKIYFWIHLCGAVLLWLLCYVGYKISVVSQGYAFAYTFIECLIPTVMMCYIKFGLKISIMTHAIVTQIFKVTCHVLIILAITYTFYKFTPIHIWDPFYQLLVCFVVYIAILMGSGKLLNLSYYTDLIKRVLKSS